MQDDVSTGPSGTLRPSAARRLPHLFSGGVTEKEASEPEADLLVPRVRMAPTDPGKGQRDHTGRTALTSAAFLIGAMARQPAISRTHTSDAVSSAVNVSCTAATTFCPLRLPQG